METNKKEIDLAPLMKLLDFTTTITEIRCDECNAIDKSYMDEWEAIEGFSDNGWEVIKDKALCPKCVDKFANKKKS